MYVVTKAARIPQTGLSQEHKRRDGSQDRKQSAPFLDRLADFELQHGHHQRAEHLAEIAAAMREAVQ